ncbi:MAG: hypothetical protein H7123_03830 [Thermoleophilia bacterium]|nr:hypothetical protein [Thermoleophilia bacterium]
MTLKFNAKSHRYYLDGKPIKGVTTLLGSLNKPAIPYWAAKSVAEHVADHLDDLEAWGRMDRESLVAALKQVPWTKRDKAAIRGTEIHALAEEIVHGREVEVPDHLLGFVQGYVDFLDAFNVTPIATECSVGNREHYYAGRFDFIGTIDTEHDKGLTWLLDWKTSAGVYGETGLQTAAYARGEFYVTDDDADTEIPMPHVDKIGVVHITESGTYLHELGPINMSFDEFLHTAALTKSSDRRKSLVGDPISAKAAVA